jgi:PAS domain S-box
MSFLIKYMPLIQEHRSVFKLMMFFKCLLLFSCNYLFSQQFPRNEVMASYIFNFAQNTQWPNINNIKRFNLKIISNDTELSKELNKISLKKRIYDKPVKIITEDHLTSLDSVNLIFVSKEKEKDLVNIFDRIEGKNILLISDNFDNREIVMINFFETKEHNLKFEINKANIINQGLSVLPNMVLLGGTEIDVAALYKESQVSLRTLQKQLETMQQHESALKNRIAKNELEMGRQQHIINAQSDSIRTQTKQLLVRNLTLFNLTKDIELKQKTLTIQTNRLIQHDLELTKQKEEIARREKILVEQQTKIDKLDTQLNTQGKAIEQQDVTISTQRNYLFLLIVILLLGTGTFIAIYRLYKKNKETNTLLTNEVEERKRIEDALGKSEDLYNNAPCGYHSLDNLGYYIRINDTELHWLGYQREEVVGKMKFTDIITPKSRGIFEENFSKFKTSGTVSDLEFELIHKDGTIRPVSVSATAILDKDGNYIMSRSSVFDITFRKKAEDAVRTMNIELEQRVNERTSQLEAANKELEAFSYSVSHDLRAPLRSIDGFSQVLLEEYKDNLDTQGQNYLARVRLGAQRMGHLIDDMLQLSRISRSDMNIQQVNLSRIAQDIINNLMDEEPDRNIQFSIQTEILVQGDQNLLQIALNNLVENAWKFTSQHPTAYVEIGTIQQNGQPVYFVRDDGAGFDMKYAQKLFGAFQRLHTVNEFPGTGVGLATVQRIIHRHGGQIWADSEKEKGATFYFTIPNTTYYE